MVETTTPIRFAFAQIWVRWRSIADRSGSTGTDRWPLSVATGDYVADRSAGYENQATFKTHCANVLVETFDQSGLDSKTFILPLTLKFQHLFPWRKCLFLLPKCRAELLKLATCVLITDILAAKEVDVSQTKHERENRFGLSLKYPYCMTFHC